MREAIFSILDRGKVGPSRANRLCHPRSVRFDPSPSSACARLLGALLVSGAAAIAAPAVAPAAPSCAEGPQTVEREIIGTPCADTIRAPRSVTTGSGRRGRRRALRPARQRQPLRRRGRRPALRRRRRRPAARRYRATDRLSGGFGADSLDGEAGDDVDRGDATVDRIGDSGGGTDTLSFATGATPGFPNQGAFFDDAGFPPDAEGRGVYVDLGDDFANNGLAPSGRRSRRTARTRDELRRTSRS